jgi:hypothetical protein
VAAASPPEPEATDPFPQAAAPAATHRIRVSGSRSDFEPTVFPSQPAPSWQRSGLLSGNGRLLEDDVSNGAWFEGSSPGSYGDWSDDDASDEVEANEEDSADALAAAAWAAAAAAMAAVASAESQGRAGW